jgi:hypothetical protein
MSLALSFVNKNLIGPRVTKGWTTLLYIIPLPCMCNTGFMWILHSGSAKMSGVLMLIYEQSLILAQVHKTKHT